MRLKKILSTAICVVTMCSCGNTHVKHDEEARALYQESIDVCSVYTDSLEQAIDSATVMHLSERFENELTKINYRHRPDAGLDISEASNDTLSRKILHFAELRDSLLRSFSKKQPLPSDSIAATDSVPHI